MLLHVSRRRGVYAVVCVQKGRYSCCSYCARSLSHVDAGKVMASLFMRLVSLLVINEFIYFQSRLLKNDGDNTTSIENEYRVI